MNVAKLEKWDDDVFRVSDETNFDEISKYFIEQSLEYDSYVILGDISLSGFHGLAEIGKVCSANSISILKMSEANGDWKQAAQTLAHELGHNLGFQHADDEPHCVCAAGDKAFCLMDSVNFPWDGTPKTIENCKIEQLQEQLKKFNCLLHRMNKRLYGICGDGVVDEGEECDCGHKELCHNVTGQDRCCNYRTCKFQRPDYQCFRGECCHNCKFISNKICRKKLGECDIVEYCNGKQSDCPKDIIKPNYQLCDKNKAFCYDGVCMNHNDLCKYVYKDENTFFSTSCLEKLHRILKSRCSSSKNEMYTMLCQRAYKICDIFLCARTYGMLHHSHGYMSEGHVCLVPKLNIQESIFAHAANFMKCSLTHNNICYNGKCTNDTEMLLNCKTKNCPGIVNRDSDAIPKTIALPPNRFGFRIFSYGGDKNIPETSGSNNFTLLITFLISMVVILFLALILIIIIVMRRRKSSSVVLYDKCVNADTLTMDHN